MAISAFLSLSPRLLNRGPGFLYRILSPTYLIPDWLIRGLRAPSAGCWLSLSHLISNWLNFLCTELCNSSTPTFFLWASQIALIQPIHGQGYTLLFLDRMRLLFTQVHFLFWQPGWVVGQYTTFLRSLISRSLDHWSHWKIVIYISNYTTKIRTREIDIFIRIRKTFTNVHKHRNPKNTKHLRLSFFGSGTKLFITFLSLRFFDMRRERHNFFLCWLFVYRQCSTPRLNKCAAHFVDPNWSRLGETKNRLPFSRLESQLFHSEFKSQLSTFFQIPKSLARRFRAWRNSRPRSFRIWGFYCDISDCYIRPAHAWTPALNVCT